MFNKNVNREREALLIQKNRKHQSPQSARQNQLEATSVEASHNYSASSQFVIVPQLIIPKSQSKSSQYYSLPQRGSAHYGSPSEMMENLIRGATGKDDKNMVSFHQRQAWGELLTNKYKLQAYKLQLKKQIAKDPQSAPHLKLLLFLLSQIERTSVDVTYGQQLSLSFNAATIKKQSRDIMNLQEEKEKLEKQLQYVSREYENILFNFNGVIQNLVQRGSNHSSPVK